MTFDEYVHLHHRQLIRFAVVLVSDGALAEDIVQTVLTRACQRWEQVEAADLPHAYVHRMVVNEYLSWRRKWQRIVPVADLEDLLPALPDHAQQWADQLAMVQLIERLPRRQRAAVALRYYEDLSDAEIAAVLGCGESTVRSNLARALATLRVRIQEPDAAPAGTEAR